MSWVQAREQDACEDNDIDRRPQRLNSIESINESNIPNLQ
jgi:hypothetical protein